MIDRRENTGKKDNTGKKYNTDKKDSKIIASCSRIIVTR